MEAALQYVKVKINNETLAIPMEKVIKIVDSGIFAELPSENPYVYGVFYWNKKILPCFSLIKENIETENKIAIIYQYLDEEIALVVSNVTDIITNENEIPFPDISKIWRK